MATIDLHQYTREIWDIVQEGLTNKTLRVGDSFLFTDFGDTPDSYVGQSGKYLQVNAAESALELVDVVGADEKVSIDSAATAGYIGAASSDGVLRTSSPLTYTDGGNFVTLGLDATAIDHDDLQNVGTNTHSQIDSHIGSTSNPHSVTYSQVGAIQDTTDIIKDTHIDWGSGANQVSAADMPMARIGASTYSTVQHLQDIFHSSGYVSGGTINDAGSGNITVDAGTGLIRATDSQVAEILYFDWSALGSTAIPSDTVRYVGVEYNAGSPQVVVHTSYDWDFNTDFPIGTVINEGGTLHILQEPHAVGDHANFMIQRMYETTPFMRDVRNGGLILGETGTRNVTVTAGALWDKLQKFSISAIDTSGAGTFDSYSSGGLESSGNTQWDNANYDNAGTLTALTSNQYVNLWWYIEADGALICVYGTDQYATVALAAEEGAPTTLPDRITYHGKLLGRFIVQEGGATASRIDSAFNTQFSSTGVTDHGGLSGLADDDHTQYHNDTRAATWLAANHETTYNHADIATNTTHRGLTNNPHSVTKAQVGLTNVEDTALSTWGGSTSITTLGTIGTGTWEGTAVDIAHGGTGQTTAQAAIDALSAVSGATNEHVLTKDTATGNAIWKAVPSGFADPMTTRGDIIYKNAAGTTTRLAAGTASQVLTSDGTDISWADLPTATDSVLGIASFDSDVFAVSSGAVGLKQGISEAVIMANNTAIQAKEAGGTAVDIAKIDAADNVWFRAFDRGANRGLRIETGVVTINVTAAGVYSGSAVTFNTAFTAHAQIFTSVSNDVTKCDQIVHHTIASSVTGFTPRIRVLSFTATSNVTFHWMAIGV